MGDFIIVTVDIGVAIIISLTTAILWTCAHLLPPDPTAKATNIKTPGSSVTQSPQGRKTDETKFSDLNTSGKGRDAKNLWHIKPPDKIEDSLKPEIVSHTLIVL